MGGGMAGGLWERRPGEAVAAVSQAGWETAGISTGAGEQVSTGETIRDKKVFSPHAGHQPQNPARWICVFLLVALTNCHKRRVLKQHKFIVARFCRLEVSIGLSGLRQKRLQGCAPSWKL